MGIDNQLLYQLFYIMEQKIETNFIVWTENNGVGFTTANNGCWGMGSGVSNLSNIPIILPNDCFLKSVHVKCSSNPTNAGTIAIYQNNTPISSLSNIGQNFSHSFDNLAFSAGSTFVIKTMSGSGGGFIRITFVFSQIHTIKFPEPPKQVNPSLLIQPAPVPVPTTVVTPTVDINSITDSVIANIRAKTDFAGVQEKTSAIQSQIIKLNNGFSRTTYLTTGAMNNNTNSNFTRIASDLRILGEKTDTIIFRRSGEAEFSAPISANSDLIVKGTTNLANSVSFQSLASTNNSDVLFEVASESTSPNKGKLTITADSIDIRANVSAPNLCPVGTIQMFANKSHLPYGWLLCNGALIDKTKYKDLYELVRDIYGVPTDFEFVLPNLPDNGQVCYMIRAIA